MISTRYANVGSARSAPYFASPEPQQAGLGSWSIQQQVRCSLATLQPLASGGAPSTAAIATFSLPSRTDDLTISCGVIFTNQGPGEVDAVIDEVHLRACPR